VTKSPEPGSVIVGDAIDIMAEWPDGCVDHCIADPPFGIASGRSRRSKHGLGWAFSSHVTIEAKWDQFTGDDFFDFNLRWLEQVTRVVRRNGNILIFGTYHNIYQLGFILQTVLKRRILSSIVWYKPNAQPNITARTLTESTEHIIWAVNESPEAAEGWTFNYWDAKELNDGRQMRNVWFENADFWESPVVSPAERRHGRHPSQKPLQITDRLVAIASRPGDLVLDPFVGTGAVGVSCLRLMRKSVLIDHDERYVSIARARIQEEAERLGVLSREESLMSLTDTERRLLQEVPVPQADNLGLVFDVVRFVAEGANSRAAVGRQLDYAYRQGPYYADAAMALGLIQDDRFSGRTGRVLSVTALGQSYLSLPETQRPAEVRRIVLNAPIMKYVASQLGVTQNGESLPYPLPQSLLDDDEVSRVLARLGTSGSTQHRRAQTLVSWLRNI